MTEILQSATLKRYRQLIKAIHDISAIQNPDVLLSHIVGTAIKLVNADAAWILLPDRMDTKLNLEIGFFKEGLQKGEYSIAIDTCLEGQSYKNFEPHLINDMSLLDANNTEIIELPEITVNSLLIAPIASKGKRIGILEIANKRNGEFNLQDQEILVSFAQQAGICYEKSLRILQADLIPELVHELRTPLASLNTALNLLQRTDLPTNRREKITQMVQTEFTRLTDLTTSYLDYARLESGKEKFNPSEFNLGDLLRDSTDVMQALVENKNLKVNLDLPIEPLIIYADRDKIKQVILNLLNNAIIYNSENGEINLKASRTPNYVSFSIADKGQGIPSKNIPSLFERFYRTPNTERQIKGTGLGLAISKQIVDAHNGKIEISSTVNQGATFTVFLPVNGDL
jgi:signal transduction histidine kinase